MSVPTWAWFAVLALIVAMLAVELFAHRRASVISGREALVWSTVWLAIGVGFGAVIWAYAGAEFGQQYFTGYLIEKSLAVDNVFVWAMIFGYFAVPPGIPAPRSSSGDRCAGAPRWDDRRRRRGHRAGPVASTSSPRSCCSPGGACCGPGTSTSTRRPRGCTSG